MTPSRQLTQEEVDAMAEEFLKAIRVEVETFPEPAEPVPFWKMMAAVLILDVLLFLPIYWWLTRGL